MRVSGPCGILFKPDMVYCEKTPDGKYKIIAENKVYTVILYEDVLKANVEKIMARITFQIECQVLKDED